MHFILFHISQQTDIKHVVEQKLQSILSTAVVVKNHAFQVRIAYCPGHNDVGIFSRVKMATLDSVVPSQKRPRREGFRYQMELNFPLQEEKEQFLARFNRVKQSLISKRRRSIDHLELLSYLLDLAEKVDQSEEQLTNTSTSSSMLNTSCNYKVLKVIMLHK